MAAKGKALRRHHVRRIKAKVNQAVVRRYYGIWDPNDRKAVGQVARTRHSCSCYMCGNPRKHSKDKLTRQEKKALDAWRHEADLQKAYFLDRP